MSMIFIGNFRSVANMKSSRGNPAPNQFEIQTDKGRVFQSYSTVIAAIIKSKTYLDPKYDYSVTTGKYRNQFLGEGIEATRKKIKSGEYIVVNLN